MSSLEEKYLNFLEYKNSDNEYKLTENGYELFENDKKGMLQYIKDYATNTMQTYKDVGNTVLKSILLPNSSLVFSPLQTIKKVLLETLKFIFLKIWT